jgi:hypothetical protein
MNDITYVGLDVHKATVCVAESGRGGEVREVGVFENRPDVLRKMVDRLGKHRRRLSPDFLLEGLTHTSFSPQPWQRREVP